MLLGYDHGMGVTCRRRQDPGITPTISRWPSSTPSITTCPSPTASPAACRTTARIMGPSTKKGGGAIRLEDWTTVGGGDGHVQRLRPQDQPLPLQRIPVRPPVPARPGHRARRRASPTAARTMKRFNWCAPILVSLVQRRRRLPLRQHRREIDEPGRDLDRDQPRPDHQRSGQDAQRHGRRRQHPVLHDHHDRRIAPRSRPALGGHGRRAGLGDPGRREELDQGQRQDRRQPRLLGEPRGGLQRRSGHGLRRLSPASATTISSRSSTRRPTTARPGPRSPATCRTSRSTSSARIPAIPTCSSSGRISASIVSLDGGKAWTKLKANMPTQPVHDLQDPSARSRPDRGHPRPGHLHRRHLGPGGNVAGRPG